MRTPAGHQVTINREVADRLGLSKQTSEVGRAVIDPLIDADERATRDGEQAGVLKSEPGRSTLRRIELGGQWWVVKRYCVAPWRTRLLHAVGQTPTQREIRGANLLHRLGRRCNRPLAGVVHRPLGSESQRVILPYLEGMAADQLVCATWDRPTQSPKQTEAEIDHVRVVLNAQTRLNLARAIGRQVGSLLAAGVVNRDHKLSNLIVDRRSLQGAEPIIIDPAGLRRRRSRRQVLRMLAMMIRTTHRAGGFTTREGLTFVKAALQADPSMGRGLPRPLHDLSTAALAWVDA